MMMVVGSHAARSFRPPLSWPALFVSALVVSVVGFFVAPWPLEVKSLALLHGLCAQRPSHSFWFGDRRLPFDARMTGIYAGFLCTQLVLLARGRLRTARLPSLPLTVLFFLFVVAMAVDGVNSTFADVRLPVLYAPSNTLRYVTGALTGISLAVFLWMLLGLVLWRPTSRSAQPVLGRWRDLALCLLPAALFGLAAGSGWTPAYPVLVLVLIAAALLAFFELSLASVQLVRARECTAVRPADLAGPALAALAGSYLLVLLLAGGRFWLESHLLLQQMR